MARALVDATVVIAFADTADVDHDRGTAIVRGIDHGTLPTGVILHGALLESVNFVAERSSPGKAVDLLDMLEKSTHYRLPTPSEPTVERGRAVFRQYPELSLADATQVAFMQDEGIDYVYSFDDDFDAVGGVTRVNSATNPFAGDS